MKRLVLAISSIIILAINTTTYTVTIPAELENLGATCYMNSTLQCLYQIHPLTNFLLKEGPNFYKPGTIAQEYIKFIEKVPQRRINRTEMGKLCDPVFDKFFDESSGQQDASEFLVKLVDRLVDEDVKNEMISKDPTGKPNFIPGTAIKISPVTDVLLPLIFSITKTISRPIDNDPNCQIEPKITPVGILDIEILKLGTKIPDEGQAEDIINKNKFETLESCLESYTAEEHVTGTEQFTCPDGKKVDLMKKIGIQTSPSYLIIALKRFLLVGTESVKDQHAVSFPLKNLDLRPYMTPDSTQTQTKYDLVSFVQHLGSRNGGHYTSYVKSNENWYFCNDSHISDPIPEKSDIPGQLDMQKIADAGTDGRFTPYILFYKRKDVPSEEEETIKQSINTLKQLEAQLQSLSAKNATAK